MHPGHEDNVNTLVYIFHFPNVWTKRYCSNRTLVTGHDSALGGVWQILSFENVHIFFFQTKGWSWEKLIMPSPVKY